MSSGPRLTYQMCGAILCAAFFAVRHQDQSTQNQLLWANIHGVSAGHLAETAKLLHKLLLECRILREIGLGPEKYSPILTEVVACAQEVEVFTGLGTFELIERLRRLISEITTGKVLLVDDAVQIEALFFRLQVHLSAR